MSPVDSIVEADDAALTSSPNRLGRRSLFMSAPPASVTRRLMLLVGATTIPLTLLSAGILYGDYRTDRAEAERALVRQAQTIALLVDREIERAQALARASAASIALARGDLASFRQELIEASRTYGDSLPPLAQPVVMSFAGLDQKWIVDTGDPEHIGRRNLRAHDDVKQAIATGQPQVSNLYHGALSGKYRVSVAVPVFSYLADGEESRRVVGAIGLSISRGRFLEIVDETRLPQGAVGSILDRQGLTIARSTRDAETVGHKPPPSADDTTTKKEFGLGPQGAETVDGIPSTIVFAHAPRSGFVVKLDIPESIFLASLRSSLLRTAGVGALVLAVGLALTALLARQLVIALRRVVPTSQAAAASGAPAPRLGLREANDVAGELTRVLIDQRAASTALAASEANLRTLADALPQLVWATRPDGSCDYFNARCYAFAGTDALDAASWMRRVHPEDRPALIACWRRALDAAEPFEIECRARRHDGEDRWMLVRTIAVREGGVGPVARWFASSTDITDIVEGREIAARGRAELEALIEQRTSDLTDMQTRLAHAARMEALGQLAGGIAHDFNNVLQAVLGGSALIERRSDDPALVAKHARVVFESAERGAAITRRLLAFSHRSSLRAEIIEPVSLLRDIQGILLHTLGAAVRTDIMAQADLPPLLADKGQLETVLVNLAANARDAMGGRGTIVMGAVAETVARNHQARLAPGAYICLSVADTGIGMDAVTLERVIEPFFTTKGAGQGTGLGLAMAHGFAGQSGGGLRIESAPGAGTTVKLWLPVATGAPAKEAAASAHAAVPRPAAALLLLVDDEALVRDVVKETLEMEGYEVVTAASGEQALALLPTVPVKLLISDLSMPGMDGVSLIRAAQRQRPGLPAILVTGFARDETEIAMSGAVSGSFSVLRKPVTSAQLCGRVADLLQTVPSPTAP